MATKLEDSLLAPAKSGPLQDLAKRHLWMHFTRMGAYKDAEVPVIVRGPLSPNRTLPRARPE